MRKLCGVAVLVVAGGLFFAVSARADGGNICPSIGPAEECNAFFVVQPDGNVTIESVDPVSGSPASTTHYDCNQYYCGDDDYLVGVYNNSSEVVSRLWLSGDEIFSDDGDGICSGYFANTPEGCPVWPGHEYNTTLQGYNGPNTAHYVPGFEAEGNRDEGYIYFGYWDENFEFHKSEGLLPGQSAYFSLENLPTFIQAETPVPEPATLLLLGTGVSGLALRLRRRQKK